MRVYFNVDNRSLIFTYSSDRMHLVGPHTRDNMRLQLERVERKSKEKRVTSEMRKEMKLR